MRAVYSCKVRAAGDVIGYCHPGNCAEKVLLDLKSDFPREDHSAEAGDWEISISDSSCVGCGATLGLDV